MLSENKIEWKEEKRKIKDLKDYDKNPRRISKEVFEKLVESIKQDGYHGRIMVYGDTILGGHQRKKALLKAGYKNTDEIAVLVPNRELTEDEFNRLNIRDNLPYGEFDFDILANEFDMDKLIEWGMPEEWLLGKDEEDIEVLESDESVPEIPTEPNSKLGDVYVLRKHRLMCGDSTVYTDVDKLLGGENPVLMVTDPPYGVNYNPEWREGADLGVGKRSKGKVLNDDKADWTEAYSLFTGNVAYVWHAGKYSALVSFNLESCGFDVVSQIIWVKQHFALSRGDYHWQHEPCWYAVKKGEKHNWQGARDQATTWEIKNNNSFGNSSKEETVGHGTQKPIECMLRPIINNTKKGQSVYDPFGGSGTTLIACEKSGRICYMMELSPAYVDVIVARWEKLTGETATLEKTTEF